MLKNRILLNRLLCIRIPLLMSTIVQSNLVLVNFLGDEEKFTITRCLLSPGFNGNLNMGRVSILNLSLAVGDHLRRCVVRRYI